MSKHSRVSVLAIHEDAVFLSRLEKLLENHQRFDRFHGYSELIPRIIQRRRQPAKVAIVAERKGGSIDSARIDAIRLSRRWPTIGLVILAEDEGIEALFDAVDAGAAGYLPRGAGTASLLDAVCLVNEGYAVVSRRMLKLLVERARSTRLADQVWLKLRESELRILSQLSTGASQKEVAEALGLAYQTVRNMCQRIYRLLGVNSQRAAVRKFLIGIGS